MIIYHIHKLKCSKQEGKKITQIHANSTKRDENSCWPHIIHVTCTARAYLMCVQGCIPLLAACMLN